VNVYSPTVTAEPPTAALIVGMSEKERLAPVALMGSALPAPPPPPPPAGASKPGSSPPASTDSPASPDSPPPSPSPPPMPFINGIVSISAFCFVCVHTLKTTLHALALHCRLAESPAITVTSRERFSLVASLFLLLSSSDMNRRNKAADSRSAAVQVEFESKF
jgi:hypothetical protein